MKPPRPPISLSHSLSAAIIYTQVSFLSYFFLLQSKEYFVALQQCCSLPACTKDFEETKGREEPDVKLLMLNFHISYVNSEEQLCAGDGTAERWKRKGFVSSFSPLTS